jgi:hypothetical protein
MIEWWPQVGAAFQRPWPRLAALWPRLARWVLAVTLLATLLFPKNLFLYVAQQKVVRIWAAVGMKLRQAAPRDLTLYVVNAGAIPYFSGLVAHDSLGLTDPVIAHRKVRLGMGLAGHEKSDLTRIADLQPDLLFINFYPAGTDLGHLVASFFQIATQLRKQARGKPVNWNLAQLIQAHPELRYDLLANTFSLSLLVNRSNLKDYSPMVLPVAGWSALFLVRREVVDYVPALQPVTLPPRPLPAGVKFGAGGPGQLSTARTPVSGSGIR